MQSIYGINVGDFENSFLTKTIKKRISETFCSRQVDYVEYLGMNPPEAAELSAALINSYSEFFRNPLTYAVLEQHILPHCLKQKPTSAQNNLRIWSAGCAAGQEPYSLAILMEERQAKHSKQIPCQIFATDISEDVLAKARSGIYDESSMQNVQFRWLNGYFSKKGSKYHLSSKIKSRVEFSRYDLCDSRSSSPPTSIYGDFDLVMCSNLLFYYKPQVRLEILDKIFYSLVSGGYFVTGEAERDIVMQYGKFQAVGESAPIFVCIK